MTHLRIWKFRPPADREDEFALAYGSDGVWAALFGALCPAIPLDCLCARLVPRRGLEPPRPCERQHLKLVRLPIPPPGHRCM